MASHISAGELKLLQGHEEGLEASRAHGTGKGQGRLKGAEQEGDMERGKGGLRAPWGRAMVVGGQRGSRKRDGGH